MRKQIFIVGIIIVALGAVLIAYGQISRSQLESVITTRDWNVTWYHTTDQFGGWGSQMGTQTLGSNFHLTTVSYAGESLHLGFKASTTFELTQEGTINFVIGSDDGSILRVDGDEQINMWLLQGYDTNISSAVGLLSTLARHTKRTLSFFCIFAQKNAHGPRLYHII